MNGDARVVAGAHGGERVPFRKSGGGNFCNTFTVSMMMRVSHVSARGVMSSGGWDQWNQLGDGDEPAQIVMNDRGAIGSHLVVRLASHRVRLSSLPPSAWP